jgi:hypothetical protein
MLRKLHNDLAMIIDQLEDALAQKDFALIAGKIQDLHDLDTDLLQLAIDFD